MKSDEFWNTTKVKIKICNIKSLETACMVSELGVDVLGFHLWQSNYSTKIKELEYIFSFLPFYPFKWILTDIKETKQINEIVGRLNFDAFQLQRFYDDHEVRNIASCIATNSKNIKLVKSVSTESNNLAEILSTCKRFIGICDAILLDSKPSGGTGILNNIPLFKEVIRKISQPVILAGGLKPDNIGFALRETNPFAVDIESGVENIVGRTDEKAIKVKSVEKIKRLVDEVRSYST